MAKYLILLFLLASPLCGAFPPEVSGPILYRLHQGECEKGFALYLNAAKEQKTDDFSLLQQMCIALLENGIKNPDAEIQFLCMFGAGIAANPSLIPVLQKGLESRELRTQVVALHYLAELEHDDADALLIEALSSPFLLTRLEAAYELAQKKNGSLLEHLSALFYKVPEEIRPLFAQIASPLPTPETTKFLEKLLIDENREVRLATLISAGVEKRDDLTARLRTSARHPDPASQEAAIHALALLQDEESKPLMHEIVEKKKEVLRLVALKALYDLGEKEVLAEILREAAHKNLYALSLLGEMPEGAETIALLKRLSQDQEEGVRLNAALSLLKCCSALPSEDLLKALLLRGERDCGFLPQSSPGKALNYWLPLTGCSGLSKVHPSLASDTLLFRQQVLRRTLELPEEDFLRAARVVFEHHQYDLVPLLIELLINQRSEKALALLREMQQKAGAPLIRNYCTLALYRLNSEGPYEEILLKWVSNAKNHPLIRLQPDKKTKKQPTTRYEFTFEETSQLLISIFETLAMKQHPAGREALLHAIAYGDAKNKYALAGLLMRMTD